MTILAATPPEMARAQTSDPGEQLFSAAFGLALGSASGIYSNSFDQDRIPSRIYLEAGISPDRRFVVTGAGRVGPRDAALTGVFYFRASGIDQTRFHGPGHYTAGDRPSAYYRVEQYRYSLVSQIRWSHDRWSLAVGPMIEFVDTDTDIDEGIPHVIGDPLPLAARRIGAEVEDLGLMQLTRPYGSGRFMQVGLAGTLEADLISPSPGRAFNVGVSASVHPAGMSLRSPYARVQTALAAQQRLPTPGEVTLAWRGGMINVWGDAPFFDLAELGGRSSLRGFAKDRFAGQASMFSQAELYVRLGRAAVVRRFDFGVFGLADVGRVQQTGLGLGEWHTTQGVGAWLRPLGGQTFTASVARGSEGVRVYVGMGWP